jgi:hypothetical protein
LTLRLAAWDDVATTRYAEAFLVPYHFDFDPTHRIARCRFEGKISDDDFHKFYAEAAELVQKLDPLGGLLDLSAVTSFNVTPQTVHDIANLPPALPQTERPRVVVAPAPAVFGLMRMFELLGERTRPSLHIVRSEREALAILGVLEPHFEPVKADG